LFYSVVKGKIEQIVYLVINKLQSCKLQNLYSQQAISIKSFTFKPSLLPKPMNPVFKKLNYKDQPLILAVNAPESFLPDLKEMGSVADIKTQIEDVSETSFVIVFVTRQDEINQWVPEIARRLQGDAIVWFCYPKGTSKKYSCDFNRDTGWQIMGEYDLEPVRQVAIDADWSALRFRKVQYIKKITRSAGMALTQQAKERTTKKGVT